MELTTITIAVAVSSAILGWLGATRNMKKDAAQDAGTSTRLSADVEYIKHGVDDIRVDMRMQGQRLDGLAERLTRVEESAKQLHKRVDRVEGVSR